MPLNLTAHDKFVALSRAPYFEVLKAYAHWRGARMAEDPKWRRMFTMHCINQVDFGIVAPEHVDEALKIADHHRLTIV